MNVPRTRILARLMVWGSLWSQLRVTTRSTADTLDVQRRPVSRITPGTVVNETPPSGWSHLILKSVPKVSAGDTEHFTDGDHKLTSMFRTVLVAHVKGHQDATYRLDRVGVGLCMPIGDKGDVVVTPETQKKLGAGLGFLGRSVLAKVHGEQDLVSYVCRNSRAAIVDYPVIMRWKGKNRRAILRYALLVQPDSGTLTSFVWVIETDSKERYSKVISTIRRLAPNRIVICPLYVDTDEYLFGIPTKRAFAINDIPHGVQEHSVPPHLAPAFAQKTVVSRDAEAMIDHLTSLLPSVTNEIAGGDVNHEASESSEK